MQFILHYLFECIIHNNAFYIKPNLTNTELNTALHIALETHALLYFQPNLNQPYPPSPIPPRRVFGSGAGPVASRGPGEQSLHVAGFAHWPGLGAQRRKGQ